MDLISLLLGDERFLMPDFVPLKGPGRLSMGRGYVSVNHNTVSEKPTLACLEPGAVTSASSKDRSAYPYDGWHGRHGREEKGVEQTFLDSWARLPDGAPGSSPSHPPRPVCRSLREESHMFVGVMYI